MKIKHLGLTVLAATAELQAQPFTLDAHAVVFGFYNAMLLGLVSVMGASTRLKRKKDEI
jgi:hypothetical protein